MSDLCATVLRVNHSLKYQVVSRFDGELFLRLLLVLLVFSPYLFYFIFLISRMGFHRLVVFEYETAPLLFHSNGVKDGRVDFITILIDAEHRIKF